MIEATIRTSNRLLRALYCLIASLLLAACFFSDSRTPGHLVLRLKNDPSTLDPAQITDVDSGAISAKLFNGLVRMDKSMKIVPDLAESWSISADRRIYVFSIRGDVAFPDGRRLSSDDVKYSFDRVLDPDTRSPMTWVFEKVTDIRTPDDRTLILELSEPFSPFIELLTMPAAFVVDMRAVESLGNGFGSAPVGTGPYRLVRWRHNRDLILEARKDYFDDAPKLEGIIYRIIPEDLTAIAEFEIGNIDVIGIPAAEYGRFRKSEKWRNLIISSHGLNTYYLGMNNRKSPLDDPVSRRAVAMAIDRGKILDTFFEGRGVLASGPVPPSLRLWPEPSLPVFDPVAARELIRKTNLNKASLSLYVTSSQENLDLAEIIQDYLGRAGLSVEISRLEWSAYKEAINRGEPDMFWMSWWADYPGAGNFLFPTFHSSNIGTGGNRAGYSNAEFDRIIEQARRTEDPDEAYREAEELVTADMPWVFFWHRKDFAVHQPWVRQMDLFPVHTMDKGLFTEIEK